MPIDRNNAQYITGAIYKPTQTSAPGVWDLDDQANNVSKNLWPLPPSAVQRSLRFNSADSAYLNRTFVAGNRRTWTWSCWIKKTRNGTYDPFFSGWSDTSNRMYISFSSADKLQSFCRIGGVDQLEILTNAVFRDNSSWYHVVYACDTTLGTGTDRLKIWVNGQQQTLAWTTTPAQNTELYINSAVGHYIGQHGGGDYSSYMLAESYFIDGLALTPTSFGETDQQTGVWIPKRYTGTYGTNGFRLSFANNSNTTALGYDSSGQGNNWTTNNFSVTPGAGNDVFVDVPSMYNTDTGLGGEVLGNYCTWNPLYANTTGVATLSNGNLDFNCPNTFTGTGTMAVTTGKWYWEITPTTNALLIGIKQAGITDRYGNTIYYGGTSITGGGIYVNGNPGANFSNWTVGDVIGVAPDMDGGLVYFYKNGVLQGSVSLSSASITTAIPAVGAGAGLSFAGSANFGQRPFVYTAPSGYKALCTTNLPAPAIGQTAANQADNHFAAVTYTGNGGTQTISTLDFQPDLLWIKRRDSNWSHAVYDSIRGAGSLKALSTNSADAEGVFNADTTYGYLSSFNNNGFTVLNGSTGGYTNLNNATYVAWCWNAGGSTVTNTSGTITSQVRANQRAGFSIVTYTGTGANATVGHGLGITPSMIILKNRFSSAQGWTIWFTGFTANEYLVLNSTASKYTFAGQWSALPTATTIGLSSEVWTNGSGNSMVGYCWAAIPGYSAFGSYTGNGSSDGPFVYLGFRPRWLLVKNITFSPTNWILHDSARALTNPDGNLLLPDQSGAEAINSSVDYIDFLANGFKVRGNGEAQNRSASTHIYAAFAETPARLSSAR